VWDSIFNALSGPLLAKLALAGILVAVFQFLRKKDTEGIMVGYSMVALLIGLRDILFAFLDNAALYDFSELALICALVYLCCKPFGPSWAFWLSLSLSALAGLLLVLEAAGLALPVPADGLRLVGLAPALSLAYIPIAYRGEEDSSARSLSLRAWLPLCLASAVYLVVGALWGTGEPFFRILLTPAFYGLLFAIALSFTNIVQGQLVSAVEYYEESIDSLYDLLMSTGAAMRSDSFLQDVVDNMIKTVVERTGADGGALLLADEFDETVSVRAIYGRYPPPFKLPENLPKDQERVESFIRHARFRLGEGILGEVSRSGKNVFVPQAGPDSPLPDNGDEEWLKAGGFMASPLILRDRIIGAVSVAKPGEGAFSERDFDRFKLLANFGSIAVANSFSFLEAAERSDIQREADIAASMQKNLIPEELPEVAGMAMGSFSSPARGVCSDYYDVIQTRADKALVVIGDAAGKGVAAGVVLVMIRSILHLITASTKDAATLLQWVNRGITGKVDSDHFATLVLAAVDAGSGMVELANAGHQAAVICRASDGSLEAVETKSVPIGVERRTVYGSTNVSLSNGDLLVLYTDGIVETMNAQGKQYGRKNLGSVIQRNRGLEPQAIVNAIRDDLESFAGGALPHDDRTLLIVKRKKA
jgi:sigma-B regulation protein RsbU (phosphoserine phosphatase)